MKGEILIYDFIGKDFWTGGGITASSVRSAIQAMDADDSIEHISVRINSPGGDVFEGIAIFNALAQAKKPVHTYNDGIAFSMAAIIALSGKKVIAAKNATYLFHNASGMTWGNSRKMLATVELLQKLDNGLAESVAAKTGLTVEEVNAKWFDFTDHTLSADEALAAKLIDEVTSALAENVPANIKDMSMQQVYAHFSKQEVTGKENFLTNIINAVKGAISTKQKTEPMNFENLKKAINEGTLKLADADKAAILNEIETATKAGNVVTDEELAAFNNDKTKLAEVEAALATEKAAHDILKGTAARATNTIQKTADQLEAEANAYNETSFDKEAKRLKEEGKI